MRHVSEQVHSFNAKPNGKEDTQKSQKRAKRVLLKLEIFGFFLALKTNQQTSNLGGAGNTCAHKVLPVQTRLGVVAA